MPRPGTEIRIVDGAAGGGAVLDTGQAFFVGVAARGPAGAVKVASTPEYETKFGPRGGGSLLYDAVASFFAEGGGTLYVSRAAGAGGAPATVAFGSLTATAESPGAWGNDFAAEAVAGLGSGFVVKLYDGPELTDQSPELATASAAAAWSEGRPVRLSKGADDVLAAVPKADLAGGADGSAPGTAEIADALARFEHGLGPGQVAAPGYTTTVVHNELLRHADEARRVALVDLPDTADPAALVDAVQALADTPGVRYAQTLAPWLSYPGPAGAPVTIPYSGVQAALLARTDAVTGNPNEAAAGANGVTAARSGSARVPRPRAQGAQRAGRHARENEVRLDAHLRRPHRRRPGGYELGAVRQRPGAHGDRARGRRRRRELRVSAD